MCVRQAGDGTKVNNPFCRNEATVEILVIGGAVVPDFGFDLALPKMRRRGENPLQHTGPNVRVVLREFFPMNKQFGIEAVINAREVVSLVMELRRFVAAA